VDFKLTMNQKHTYVAVQANCILDYVSNSISSRSKEVIILSLLSTHLGTLEHCSSLVLTPQYKTDTDKLEQVSQKASEMIKELEHRTRGK